MAHKITMLSFVKKFKKSLTWLFIVHIERPTSFATVRGILRKQMNGVSVGMDMNELSHVTN